MHYNMTTETYSRTASGRGWKSKPDTVEHEEISRENYNNRADDKAIKFWNGFCGGTCRAERGYTPAGYIPVRISRVSPDRQTKIVDRFHITYEED